MRILNIHAPAGFDRRIGLRTEPARDLPPAHPRRPRLRELPDRATRTRASPRSSIRGSTSTEYLRLARYLGVRIEHVLETHNHADHVSGHGRLVAATGATIHIHREAAPDYDHEPFDDGWELELGDLVGARAAHARPPARAHRVRARRPRSRRRAVGGAHRRHAVRRRHRAARPRRRQGGGRARHLPLARRRSWWRCPTRCEVWPGHLGGSLCGGPGMDLKVSSTIGFERAHQALLRIEDEDEFVARDDRRRSGRSRRTSANIVALNRGPLVGDVVEAHPLTPRQVEQRADDGALVVDVRTELQFDEAHIPGAVCITARRAGLRLEARLDRRAGPAARAGRPRRRGRARGRRAGRRGRPARDRRLPRRRDDLVARGAARRSSGVARMTVPELHERRDERPGARRARARRVGRRPPPRLASTCPTTTSTRSPTGSTRRGRWPRSAAPASASAVAASLLKRLGAARRHPRRRRRRPALAARGLADRALLAHER